MERIALSIKTLSFIDLGLVIVDEEQSFGVDQKEQLKSMFPESSCINFVGYSYTQGLFQMAFSGIRDLSLINTPPKNRMPIETNVIEFDQGTIRSAIMREIKRDGQVFFVVPRIKDIRTIEDFLNEFYLKLNIWLLLERQVMRARKNYFSFLLWRI